MQPNQPTYQPPASRSRSRGLLILGLLLLVVVGLGLATYKSIQFHVVRTDPPSSTVPTVVTGMTIYTNKELAKGSLNLYDPGGLIAHSSLSGKTVRLDFAVPLQANKRYEFFIQSLRSQSGSEISNQSIAFVAKNVPFDQLTPAQQQQVLKNQDKYSYSIGNISWTGFGNLLDQGLTAGELLDVQTDIFNYTNQIKQQFKTIPLDTKSLSIYFHDPSTREAYASSATFTINLGGINYKVRSEYDGISNNTYTRIYDNSGKVVYDSSAQ